MKRFLLLVLLVGCGKNLGLDGIWSQGLKNNDYVESCLKLSFNNCESFLQIDDTEAKYFFRYADCRDKQRHFNATVERTSPNRLKITSGELPEGRDCHGMTNPPAFNFSGTYTVDVTKLTLTADDGKVYEFTR